LNRTWSLEHATQFDSYDGNNNLSDDRGSCRDGSGDGARAGGDTGLTGVYSATTATATTAAACAGT